MIKVNFLNEDACKKNLALDYNDVIQISDYLQRKLSKLSTEH